MYPVAGVCDLAKLPISLPVNANGGRHIDATSEYKSNVWAAVYLFMFILFCIFSDCIRIEMQNICAYEEREKKREQKSEKFIYTIWIMMDIG